MHGKVISFGVGFLRDVNSQDSVFIEQLFSEPDVDFYYVRQPYHRNSKVFTQFMVQSLQRGNGFYDIICTSDYESIGLISAELMRESISGEIQWNVGYAVLSDFRNLGYASSALMAYTNSFKEFSIKTAYLDISVDNPKSESVAKKCGYELRDRNGFLDPLHPEVGLRKHWYKSIHLQDARIPFFQKANIAYKNKDYISAITIYLKALDAPYLNGSPLTDAQIYSNIGMAYSSLGEYDKAFFNLKKAKEMGLRNESIERELLWLKNKIGLF